MGLHDSAAERGERSVRAADDGWHASHRHEGCRGVGSSLLEPRPREHLGGALATVLASAQGSPNFAASAARTAVPDACEAKLPGDSLNSSNTAANATDGCSKEAEPMNQPLGLPDGVSAVPLFPATETAKPRNGKYTVPSGSDTTARMQSRMSESSVFVALACPAIVFSSLRTVAPLRSRISVTRRGFHTIPSFASAAA